MNQHVGHLVGTHNQTMTLENYVPGFWSLAQYIASDNHECLEDWMTNFLSSVGQQEQKTFKLVYGGAFATSAVTALFSSIKLARLR